MATAGNRSDFVTRVRQSSTRLLNSLDELRSLQRTYDAGMSSWLTDARKGSKPEDYDPGDFKGENEGLTKSDIESAFGALGAIDDLLDEGHGTSLERVRL